MDYSTVLSRCARELRPSGIRKFFDILEEETKNGNRVW